MFVGGFLRVCPIHRYLLLISSSAGTWLILSQRSLLLMVTGQRIFSIPRRQELMNVCTFLMVVFVVRHVSAPDTLVPRKIVRMNETSGLLNLI
jgi:hypothetical protein